PLSRNLRGAAVVLSCSFMPDLRRMLTAPEDPKGRLISIFVGAVLLPSLALSYVSWHFVKKLAATEKMSKTKRAESELYYIEKELRRTSQQKAQEAAQVVGLDRLIDGRPQVVQPALLDAGIGDDVFETLHLEGSSPRAVSAVQGRREREDERRCWRRW